MDSLITKSMMWNFLYITHDILRVMLATTSKATNWTQQVNGRIVSADPVETLETYVYNEVGNIMSKSGVGNYIYSETGYANPHAVTSVNGTTYTYDNNGNLTTDGIHTNTWNYNNTLKQTVKGSTTYTYGYDHTGSRVFYGDGTATTTYTNKYFDATGSTSTK